MVKRKTLTNKRNIYSGDKLQKAIRIHQNMLEDGIRNRLLYDVLKKTVSEDTRFLDVGSGTGVWAVIAAKLGAQRVVAIEINEYLIPIIYQHAIENDVADKIEIIHAHSDNVRTNGKFDVILSELFGKDVYGKETIRSFVKIRDRFLAPNGVLFPHKMEKYAVPVQIKNQVKHIPAELPIKCDFLTSVRLNHPSSLSLAKRENLKILAKPKKLLEVDFREIVEPPKLNNLSASWKLEDLSAVNAIAIYDHSIFTEEARLNAFESKSWSAGLYEFERFSEQAGEIEFCVNLEPKQLNWKIQLPSHPEVHGKVYSPGLGLGRVMMAKEATPFCEF